MIEAGSLRNKKVISSDNKTVGIIQNVLFEADTINPIAYILVFLAEKNWLKKYLEESWARITIQTLLNLLPDQTSSIIKDATEKGEKEALEIWKAYLKNRSAKDQSALKCYLFPSSFIDESAWNDKEVKLKTDQKNIDDLASIGIPANARYSNNMFAFYEDSLVKNRECIIPITLNKTTIHLKTIADSNRDKGLISDIQLDISRGHVANFIIEVMGQNAGRRSVPLTMIDFNTQTICEGKLFGACPLLQS